MVSRLSKRFQKILLVKEILGEYQGDNLTDQDDNLTDSELLIFANKLIRLADSEDKYPPITRP